MLNELEKVWDKLPFDSEWYSHNELAQAPRDVGDVRAVAGPEPP